MAKLKFLLQAVESGTHAAEVRSVLRISAPIDVLISVAFVRKGGVAAIATDLRTIANKTRCFVGIRNEITSLQAIEELLTIGVKVFAVDTASRHVIFHPKIYLAHNGNEALAVIGSANLTFRGLHSNIEGSSIARLHLTDPEDARFVSATVTAFANLILKHPKHVFEIKNTAQAKRLFDQGRLTDETVLPRSPTINRAKPGVVPDDLPPMKLAKVIAARTSKSYAPQAVAASKPQVGYELVWESKPLMRRSLQIPDGTNTNPTGDIGLGKGSFASIDPRTYFRSSVFGRLTWAVSKAGTPNLERAAADFELIVKNIHLGVHTLDVTHDANPKSIQALRKNHVTSLKWGLTTPLIAREDLLDRRLYLWRQYGTTPPKFLIEID